MQPEKTLYTEKYSLLTGAIEVASEDSAVKLENTPEANPQQLMENVSLSRKLKIPNHKQALLKPTWLSVHASHLPNLWGSLLFIQGGR